MELALMPEGPLGPHSCLAARLASLLRTHQAPLVAEVTNYCTPRDGTLRLKQLLARAPGLPDTSGLVPGADDPIGGNFLHWVPSPVDLCVALNLNALLRWNASGSTAGSIPDGPAQAAAAASIAFQQQRFAHKPPAFPGALPYRPAAAPAGVRTPSNGIDLDLSGLVPRYGKVGADLESPYNLTITDPAADGVIMSEPGEGPAGGSGVNGIVNLAYMAFPGASPASQLRRGLVGCIASATGEAENAGLPPHCVPWRQIAPMVSGSRAAAVCPSLTTPAIFKAFLLHPASNGAFAATRVLRDPSNPGSNVDCVGLNVAAVRRVAAAGIAAAVAACWPGTDALSQLKRVTAEVLSRAWSPTHGSYCMNSGLLGAELKKRRPTLYAHVRGPGAVGGLMPRLDESDWGGHLHYVREDGKEGYMQLKLIALLREYPRDDADRDVGLNPGPATATTAGTTQPAQVPGSPGGASGLTMEARTAHFAPSSSAGPAAPSLGSDDYFHAAPVVAEAAASVPDPWANVPRPLPFDHVVTPSQPSPAPAFPAEVPDVAAAVADSCTAATAAGASAPVAHHIAMLVEPAVNWVRQPSEFDTMLFHCYSAASVGLAVHVNGGTTVPAVAAIYSPACVTDGNGAIDANGVAQQTVSWPCTVYLLEVSLISVASGGEGGAAAAATALPGAAEAFCALIESPYVSKVVYGCEKVAALAPLCGAAAIAPVLDVRIVLQALTCMLPPLPALPARPALPYAGVGPLAAMTMGRLNTHVAGLRDELIKTGLWLERQDLLGALVARHTAALREDLFGSLKWSSEARGQEAALVAAACHLPELWEALTYEAVPWVAMAASAAKAAAVVSGCSSSAGGTGSAGGSPADDGGGNGRSGQPPPLVSAIVQAAPAVSPPAITPLPLVKRP